MENFKAAKNLQSIEQTLHLKDDNNKNVSSEVICPRCGVALLEYDGKLNLYCPSCRFEAAAGFT